MWAFLDDRPGNNTQTRGVGRELEARGFDVEYIEIQYNKLAKLPNAAILLLQKLLEKPVISSECEKSTATNGDFSGRLRSLQNDKGIIISAGRRESLIATFLKKQNKNLFLVQLMNPHHSYEMFDVFAVPEHDQTTALDKYENVIYTIGAANIITDQLLERDGSNVAETIKELPKPHIVMLVGGDTKFGKFNGAKIFAKWANEEAKTLGGSLLITTSKRTSKQTKNAIKQSITTPCYFYEYGSGDINPYPGLLYHADYIIVSGDSVSMCNEACSSGKPVYIYDAKNTPAKHKKLHQSLYSTGCAKPFLGKLESWKYEELHQAGKIADLVVEKYTLTT